MRFRICRNGEDDGYTLELFVMDQKKPYMLLEFCDDGDIAILSRLQTETKAYDIKARDLFDVLQKGFFCE